MSNSVDLNADLGESFGKWPMGNDDDILKVISSANVACGFHAGDPLTMRHTVERAKEEGVAIGAHPGYYDLWGFGRRPLPGEKPETLLWQVTYQIGALSAIADALGYPIGHVKAHGALSNRAMADRPVADAIGQAIAQVDEKLVWYVLPATELEASAKAGGRLLAREIFADRAYEDDGTLVSRAKPNAMVHDPDTAADNVLAMCEQGAITSINGVKILVAIDTICVHGDNPGAVALADRVRNRLEQGGWTVTCRNKEIAA
ncbi:MAG: 5-oxoprolinase subunit PxpA [Pseudomonadota bacterium]